MNQLKKNSKLVIQYIFAHSDFYHWSKSIQLVKESYILDFLELGDVDRERQLETSIVENITKFMFELGKGFA
ncbi:DUF1016 family protein [Scytonema sp. UIC 10036]|nr:DUF1016 family protein [Scytonema sp. UIC 10036]